jgi:2-oxoglutarate ferredoxin oxidoreductase subunit beta
MSPTEVAAKTPNPLPFNKEDFVSGQEVRWCPGCGDYAILATAQRTLAKFNVPREKYVFVSGIGCSSRFPYYMNTYGFHTIHGRAPTIASGLKCVNPDLSVWVVTGDGDGLSIGGNHLVHCMRRNVDLNILLVNNQIYGLTKGQYSPTSEMGKVTKSTPMGSIDYPINALCIAIASEATFIARTLDTDPIHMSMIMERAMKHKGVSFVEIYQNCIIFNDKTFAPVIGRENREDRMVYLEHGKPLVFGKQKDKSIRLNGLKPEVVPYKEGDTKDLVVHDEKLGTPHYAYLLTQMTYPEMPVPFGVLRAIEKPTYEEMMTNQIKDSTKKRGKGTLQDLIYGGETWTVK